ncbi:glycosyltransferase, partial [Candidatus Uhrbacteria bacterium]|nr:glycosyltransferase [Candidatus Uhrbacteria bacterium]
MSSRCEVSAIVSAYNEAETIEPIIKLLSDSELFREIIVVTDGSTDQTPELARQAGATQVFHSPVRQGKGLAMRQGALAASSPYIFFCDADLIGLRKEHLLQIIDPVANGETDMCVDLHDRGVIVTWMMRHLPLIGGER